MLIRNIKKFSLTFHLQLKTAKIFIYIVYTHRYRVSPVGTFSPVLAVKVTRVYKIGSPSSTGTLMRV